MKTLNYRNSAYCNSIVESQKRKSQYGLMHIIIPVLLTSIWNCAPSSTRNDAFVVDNIVIEIYVSSGKSSKRREYLVRELDRIKSNGMLDNLAKKKIQACLNSADLDVYGMGEPLLILGARLRYQDYVFAVQTVTAELQQKDEPNQLILPSLLELIEKQRKESGFPKYP